MSLFFLDNAQVTAQQAANAKATKPAGKTSDDDVLFGILSIG